MTDPAAGTLRAVLIGTSTQIDPSLGSIPQVANNLIGLARALSAPGGLVPAGAVEVLQDPLSPPDVFRVIARQPKDGTLLCYFSGHGLRAEDRLCLALPGSIDRQPDQRSTSLPVEALLEQLGQGGRRRVILILDCCFAGLAFREPAASDMHLLVAVGKTEKARYTGAHHTVFTEALLKALNDGVADGTRYVDLDALYRRILLTIMEDPENIGKYPHQRTVDDTAWFRIAPNRAYEAVLTPAGLVARADFAAQVGFGEDPERAARLSADLVRDAYRSSLIEAADLFRCRQDVASWAGRGGDVESAVRQLETMLAEDPAGVRPADLDLAAQSLKFWRGRV